MITKLKKKFIALAMVSLVLLLTIIVAGMNILNYNTVVSNADDKLTALSEYGGRFPFDDDDIFGPGLIGGHGGFGLFDDDWFDADDLDDDDDDSTSKPGFPGFGRGNPYMSRDEAEESRYFSVLVNGDGTVVVIDTDRIYAVDDSQAAEYAQTAIKRGKDKGFIGEYRYVLAPVGNFKRVTFLDCSTSLAAFRRFLYSSIAVSLVGLLVIFAIIWYFAGRIVKPVAESYEKQKQFITDAGHEIKTPLAIIKANIDVMRMDLEDIENIDESDSEICEADAGNIDPETAKMLRSCADSLNESLADIDGQVDRLTSLTNDLVYLSRMEEGDAALTMTEIPVSDIVSETVDSFSALAYEKNKLIATDITPMLSIQGSSKEIEKLVSILVENALKYSPEGDCIHVGLHKDSKNVVLEVRNKAASPLSEEDLEHVFDRFYRTDKSRNSEAGGHGIGLSMASAIVSAHGGRIRARSGDGTDFIVTATLPATA